MRRAAPTAEPLVPLARAAEAYAEAALSPATRRAYASDWRQFTTWCAVRQLEPLPAAPGTVAMYVADLAPQRRVSTVQRRLAAIATAHELAGFSDKNPTRTAAVRKVMAGIRRTHAAPPDEAAPVTLELLEAMVNALPDDTAAGLRDRTILLVGFAAALRRSELVGVDVADVSADPRGRGVILTVRQSKTDQEGHGQVRPLPHQLGASEKLSPVRALSRWREAAGITAGPIFRPVDRWGNVRDRRLSGEAVALVVKRAAAAIGLEAEVFSGHSLRAGFATAAAYAGAPERAIARQTGHRSMATLRRYVRTAEAWEDNAVLML